MTHDHPDAPQYDAESYLSALVTQLNTHIRSLRAVAPHDRDDVVLMALEAYHLDADHIRASYPDPAVWSRVKLRTAAVDFARRQGAQKGTGARFTRTVDTIDPQDPAAHVIAAVTGDPADVATTALFVGQLLEVLSDEDRHLFVSVKGLQFTTREIAAELGITENCACRRLTRIAATLRELAVAA